jgi:hypothetical protein
MSDKSTQSGSYVTRLPFNSGDGVTLYCVEVVMTDDPSWDDVYAVPTPNFQTAPTYCADCLGELGGSLENYGPSLEICMHVGQYFSASSDVA